MTTLSASSSLPAEALTSDERWRRWQQRGVANEIRFNRRVRRVVIAALIIAGLLLLGWIGTR